MRSRYEKQLFLYTSNGHSENEIPSIITSKGIKYLEIFRNKFNKSSAKLVH